MRAAGPSKITAFLAVAIILSMIPAAAFSQDGGAPPEAVDGSGLTAPSIVAVSFPMASTVLSFVPLFAPDTAGMVLWMANPVRLGAHVPMYWIHPLRALGYTAAGLALPAAGVGLMFAGEECAVARPFSNSFLSAYSHLMEYSAYDVYRSGPKGGGGNGLGELAIAPFKGENIISTSVWLPTLAAAASLVGFYLVMEPDLGTPVYESGHSHVGSAQVSVTLGGISAAAFGAVDMVGVSVGEESYYRGILYEEGKRAFGTWPARAMDMVFFPAIHIPTDLQSGFRAETVLFNFAWRSAMTLAFDCAYDEGGLPLSVSLHFWSDFLLVMAKWAFYGG